MLEDSGKEQLAARTKMTARKQAWTEGNGQPGDGYAGIGTSPSYSRAARLIDRLGGQVAPDRAYAENSAGPRGFGRLDMSGAGQMQAAPAGDAAVQRDAAKYAAAVDASKSGTYGPPAPASLLPSTQQGPAAPEGSAKKYRPKNKREWEMFNAGVDSATWRGNPEYDAVIERERNAQKYFGTPTSQQQAFKNLTQAEWLAYLHGLGVQ
jgi:hypothetical protein